MDICKSGMGFNLDWNYAWGSAGIIANHIMGILKPGFEIVRIKPHLKVNYKREISMSIINDDGLNGDTLMIKNKMNGKLI